jgi:hypothetical protein
MAAQSLLRLVFHQRAGDNSSGHANLERQQLALIRRELGLPLHPGQEAYIHR